MSGMRRELTGNSSGQLKRLAIIVCGRVQGVGYRYFAREQALRLGFTGWVRNEPDGSVQLEVQGDPARVYSFCDVLEQGPLMSHVTDIKVSEIVVVPDEAQFLIHH